ncbi:hypothetical protein BT96DRAFT_985629 [Gymnopus androsaceus JB14]|uniref:Uncharacterized protein n=1 Tax=Gymnopus androsaceus JB14 TaxID=1447944 RepID=A0A6A4I9J6_9AGAR|nr:hypothetical protein BT96DRAFT_985629 [Gymnopus androsaceus JB14]
MPPPLANEGIDISVLVYHPEIDLKYLKCNSCKRLLWTSLTIRPELKTPNLLAKINDIPDHAMQKVYYDAFAVLEDELLDKTGAFRMSPTMERVLPVTKLRDIVNKREFGGILMSRKSTAQLLKTPGDRAIIEQHHLVPYAEVAFEGAINMTTTMDHSQKIGYGLER